MALSNVCESAQNREEWKMCPHVPNSRVYKEKVRTTSPEGTRVDCWLALPSDNIQRGYGRMVDLDAYTYTAETQAAFYKAESEVLRLDGRLAHNELAKHMKVALLAIDAVFASRLSHDVELSVVPLISAFGLSRWKKGYRKSARKCIQTAGIGYRFSPGEMQAAIDALYYMQTIDWISDNVNSKTVVTIETVLQLHEFLLSGFEGNGIYHGFRKRTMADRKGSKPASIPAEINDLCTFINEERFSPIGQASAINHAFERIAPFDSLNNLTALVVAFLSLFKRGLFIDGCMVPICWGVSANKEDRTKMRASTHDQVDSYAYERYREHWALFNARNTYYSVVITDSFLNATERLRASWMSSGMRIPANSALEGLIDAFLGTPQLSIKHAASIVGKSYGATSEAMRQLTSAGIVREVALDNRERIFVCDESAKMITGFVEHLDKICQQMELDPVQITPLAWRPKGGGA